MDNTFRHAVIALHCKHAQCFPFLFFFFFFLENAPLVVNEANPQANVNIKIWEQMQTKAIPALYSPSVSRAELCTSQSHLSCKHMANDSRSAPSAGVVLVCDKWVNKLKTGTKFYIFTPDLFFTEQSKQKNNRRDEKCRHIISDRPLRIYHQLRLRNDNFFCLCLNDFQKFSTSSTSPH